MPYPDKHDHTTADAINDRRAKNCLGRDTRLDPEPQAIEAPGGCPAHHRSKENGVHQLARHTEARLIVVPGEKSNTVASWNVLPIARSRCDKGLGIIGPEAQRGGTFACRSGACSRGLTFSSDRQPEAQTGFVEKLLWRFFIRFGEIADGRKAKVPTLVERRILCQLP